MIKTNLSIFFFLLLLSCGSSNKHANQDKEVQVENTPDEESEVKRDSLGYPEYYVHPSIRDIKDLRKLLTKADEVRGYNFNGNNGNPASVECDHLYGMGLCKSATNEKKLSRTQISKLINMTCDTTTYTGEWSGIAGVCFIPHMGFAFFRHDSVIAQVNICFICQGIRTVPYYKSDGLTRKGAQRYADLAKELGLKIVDGGSEMEY